MTYAELHAHTNFSLLDGTSDPEDMVTCAAALGLRALAITDHDTIAGIVRFAAAAKQHDLHAIIGVELSVEAPAQPSSAQSSSAQPAAPRKSETASATHLTLLAQDLDGYKNVCALLTEAYARGGKDHPTVPFERVAAHGDGLIALSGCPGGELPQALAHGGVPAALAVAARYRDVFGDRYYVELGRHALQADGARNAGLLAVAQELGLGCVATNDVHYHDTSRALLHHVVTCIRHGVTLETAGTLLRGNDEYFLKSAEEMAWLFREEVRLAAEAGRPELDPIGGTLAIAERCTFGLGDLRYEFPAPRLPVGESALSFLARLVGAGKALFYPHASAEVDARLKHELDIVQQLNLAGYLLVFREIVDWSHQQGILCSIRGSAPASALLYCLGLCPIDPVEHSLLFERFCSPERQEFPDIDLDFAHERREEVIQHVYQKYGRENAAMVCEVNTYRIKSALRDVAKVLGLSAQRAQQLADQVDWYDADPRDRIVREEDPTPAPRASSSPYARSAGPRDQARATARLAAEHDTPGRAKGGRDAHIRTSSADDDPRIGGRMAELLIALAQQLLHSPRHHSIHVGGMVISSQPLANVTSIEPARMPDRTIIPWDKDDITLLAEEFKVQLIKMDLLGLGMLSAIGRCFEYVRELTGRELRLHGFRYDDRVFDVLCEADTIGLFQVESRAQQSFLPRLKPRTLSEVAISVGAIRPGPGAARAGEHIVRRKHGREPITYPAPELEGPLKETYGVLLWQEQCIQVAVTAAGYTPGEADQLRRAMSHKRSYERMNAVCEQLVERMLARGYTIEVADSVRKMIVGFAGYGFPRAHAYPFAHLALISATLRLWYPAAYYAAMLNCQPMGFYAPHTLVWDAYRHGVRVLPVDVNRSAWECTLEPLPPAPSSLGEGGMICPGASPQTPPGASAPDPTDHWPLTTDHSIRLGFKEVHGLGTKAREVLERECARGPFRSMADFVARTGFDRETLERLAEVGAFLSLAGVSPDAAERRAATWATGELAGFTTGHLPGLAEQVAEAADLPPMTDWEAVQADYRGVGFSIERHVVSFFRPRLNALRALPACDLPAQKRGLVVRAGGMVIVRQRPETAGHLVFLTLEDETGLLNAIVHPHIFERFRRVLRGEPLIVLEGPIQKQDEVTHILVRKAWPLVQGPTVTRVPSHDFH